MLRSTNDSGDGLKSISVDQADQIVDKVYARQTIDPGQLLLPELLRKDLRSRSIRPWSANR